MFHTGCRQSGLDGEYGTLGIEGYLRKKTHVLLVRLATNLAGTSQCDFFRPLHISAASTNNLYPAQVLLAASALRD